MIHPISVLPARRRHPRAGHFAEPLESRTLFGVHLLKDFYPGSSGGGGGAAPVVLGDVIYFDASDPAHGRELWRSDGTTAGTWRITDINPGALSGLVGSELVVYNGAIYFAGDDGQRGAELWRSDGTAGGTTMVKDLLPGGFSSAPVSLTITDDSLYFRTVNTNGPGTAPELWKTDGTAAGTQFVTSADDKATFFFPRAALNKVFFISNRNTYNTTDAWATDGTASGTVLLHHFGSVNETAFRDGVEYHGQLYFIAVEGDYNLWRTDGSPAGTVECASILPPGVVGIQMLGIVNDQLLFWGRHATLGLTIWTTDGTLAGTSLLADPVGISYASNGNPVGHYKGKLYFATGDSRYDRELWRTDGTAAGTELVCDIAPGADAGSHPRAGVVIGDYLWFCARLPTTGYELWRTDGTAGGTILAEEFNPGTSSGAEGDGLVSFGSHGMLSARNIDNGYERFVIEDGTFMMDGTVKVPGEQTPDLIDIAVTGSRLAVTANDRFRQHDLSQVKRIIIDGYDGDDTIYIDQAVPGCAMTINAGSGSDTVFVGRNATLIDSPGALFIDAGAGADTLVFDDQLNTAPRTYLIGPGSLGTGTGAPCFWNNVEAVSLRGGAGDDVFQVKPCPVAAVVITGGSSAGDQLRLDTVNVINPQISPTTPGDGAITSANRQPVTYHGIESTGTVAAPRIISAELAVAPMPRLVFTFDADVSVAPDLDDALLVLDTDGGRRLTPVSNSYDAATRSISFGLDPAALRNGFYQAVLSGWAVTGLPATVAMLFNFSWLNADCNRDGVVDISDLAVLATNWQQSGRTFATGDFNYDGRVDISDLAILATHWQAAAQVRGGFAPEPDSPPARLAPAARPLTRATPIRKASIAATIVA